MDRRTLLNGLSALIVVGTFLLAACRYTSLPAEIPAHYGPSGLVDAYAAKSTLWAPVVLSAFSFLALFFLQRYPHRFHYPVPVPEGSKACVWRMAQRTLALLTLYVSLTFAAVVGMLSSQQEFLPLWLLIFIVIVPALLGVYFYWRCLRLTRNAA